MSIQKYGSQKRLLENQLYTVEFVLGSTTVAFSFSSRYSPLYTTVKILRNDFPEFFAPISDDSLNFTIWQTSLLIPELAEDAIVNGVPTFAAKQYARYKSEYDIVRNLLIQLSTQVGSEDKKLGEFQISKETNELQLKDILKALDAEVKKWEAAMGVALQSRGAVRAGANFPYPLNVRASF